MCNFHLYLFPELSQHPQRKLHTHQQSFPFLPFPSPWQPLICFKFLHECSQQLYSHECKHGNNLNVHQGIWDGEVHIVIFKVDHQQGPTIQHRELCSMSCGSLHGRGVWGRMDTCIRMAQSLCCPPENITALIICYTPIQS